MPRLRLRFSRSSLVVLLLGTGAFAGAAWLRVQLTPPRDATPRAVPAGRTVALAAADLQADRLPEAIRGLEKDVRSLQGDLMRIDRTLARHRPKGSYVVIDTAHNRLWLKKGDRVVREAICSTGSGKVLRDPAGGRSWVFSTPRGEFHVTNRLRNPMWRKPDWAFIEEGEPVPGRKDAVERFEDGVLGEYALAFGDGFLIHGTLYSRLLGKSVTHGCVRLGSGDLKAVFDATDLHSKILIF